MDKSLPMTSKKGKGAWEEGGQGNRNLIGGGKKDFISGGDCQRSTVWTTDLQEVTGGNLLMLGFYTGWTYLRKGKLSRQVHPREKYQGHT